MSSLILNEFTSNDPLYADGAGDKVLRSHGFLYKREPFTIELIAYDFAFLFGFLLVCFSVSAACRRCFPVSAACPHHFRMEPKPKGTPDTPEEEHPEIHKKYKPAPTTIEANMASSHCNPTMQFSGRVCDFQRTVGGDGARRRVESLDETKRVFATPPPPEECPLCCHPMPESAWDCNDPEMSNQISSFRPCCGKNICCGCVFAVHHPEFKDPETFMRSINPVFLKPTGGPAPAAAKKSNEAKGGKSNKTKGGKTNKKKGRGKKKGGKGTAQPSAKSAATSSCKAEPPSGNSPPPSDEFVPVADLFSPERTVQLHRKGTIKWESQGTCPFCRSPELKGSDLIAALRKRIEDQNCPDSLRAMGDNHYAGDNGLGKSLKKARGWWERSAELGDMLAHYALGVYHLRDEREWKGLGFKENMGGCKDLELARHHLTEAAILGHPQARYNLAYFEAQDGQIRRAFAHYLLAARQGYTEAMKQCEKIHEQGAILSESDYQCTLEEHRRVKNEMVTEQRELAMRHRWVAKRGVLRSDPLGSFATGMYGRVFTHTGIMWNGKKEFRFNPEKGKYEEVTNKGDFKLVGRLDADGRPLKTEK